MCCCEPEDVHDIDSFRDVCYSSENGLVQDLGHIRVVHLPAEP